MNNAQYSIRVGLFFILGIALVWVTYETLGSKSSLKASGYVLVAGFDNVKELKAGDDIRMAGVRIGAVETTRLAGPRAEAVLRIDRKFSIPGDAVATISSAGLLGTNYIALTLGSPDAPPLAPGSEIRTTASPDLNTIMTQLGELGGKLEGALGSVGELLKGEEGKPGLFQRLDALLADNSDKVSATLSNLQAITNKINQGEGTLGKLVNDPQLHDELLAAVEQLRAAAGDARTLVDNTRAVVDQVKSGQGALGTLIYDEATAENLRSTVAGLRSVSDKLSQGEGTLGKLINDDTMYREAQSTLRKADRALDGLGDSGPITAVGVVANALF
ncbi:MAG: MCE family protein [Opitutaceae bacterium]|nr:MCE family protein [Opitutaceae bacterium]